MPVERVPEEGVVKPEIIKPVPPVSAQCIGCRQNGACLQYCIRMLTPEGRPVYCGVDSAFKPQKALEESCQNNYECLSNSCADQKCVSVEERILTVEKELKEQRGILQKLIDFFKHLFGGWFFYFLAIFHSWPK